MVFKHGINGFLLVLKMIMFFASSHQFDCALSIYDLYLDNVEYRESHQTCLLVALKGITCQSREFFTKDFLNHFNKNDIKVKDTTKTRSGHW